MSREILLRRIVAWLNQQVSNSEVKFFLKSHVEEVRVFRGIGRNKKGYVDPACRICKKIRTMSLLKAESLCADIFDGDAYYTCGVPGIFSMKRSDITVSLLQSGHLAKPGICPEGIEISKWSVAASSTTDISTVTELLLFVVLVTCFKQFSQSAQVELKLALAGC